MKLCLFGVLHASPICRNRYRSRIADMFCDNGPPSFLAVEAAPRLFQAVILPQRDRFHELAMADTEFKRYGTPFVEALATCIGFEADAHEHVYTPGEPHILWLDGHRDCDENDQGCARSLGRNYYCCFKRYLSRCATAQEAFDCIHSGITADISSKVPVSAESTYRRDLAWSELILAKLRERSACTYAIAIVGLDHIERNPLSILSRLAGTITCEPIDLTKP